MIEVILKEYLENILGEKVYMEIPEKLPDRFVLVEKTGGGCENYINSATVAIQSYAPTLYEVCKLNKRVKAAMLGAITLDSISASKLNADYNFTDTNRKRYRYQAIFDLTYFD